MAKKLKVSSESIAEVESEKGSEEEKSYSFEEPKKVQEKESSPSNSFYVKSIEGQQVIDLGNRTVVFPLGVTVYLKESEYNHPNFQARLTKFRKV